LLIVQEIINQIIQCRSRIFVVAGRQRDAKWFTNAFNDGEYETGTSDSKCYIRRANKPSII